MTWTVEGGAIRRMRLYLRGSVHVTEIVGTDGRSWFVKTRHGVVEAGGTEEWGTGSEVR